MSTKNFFGLSLNERLNKAGIADQFSQAVSSKNTSRMSSLLRQVDYSQQSADATAKTFENNPGVYKR